MALFTRSLRRSSIPRRLRAGCSRGVLRWNSLKVLGEITQMLPWLTAAIQVPSLSFSLGAAPRNACFPSEMHSPHFF